MRAQENEYEKRDLIFFVFLFFNIISSLVRAQENECERRGYVGGHKGLMYVCVCVCVCVCVSVCVSFCLSV